MTIEGARPRGAATLVSIQYLRAIAATAVVYYHIFSNHIAAHWAGGRDVGLSGVDIFFVVSGFIMWMSTGGRRNHVRWFLKRRIFRIYPMWWIALSAWIAMRFVIPDHLHNADVTRATVICSYLLVPHFHAVFAGHVWPILVPGWSLQFEMFFYLVFAVTLLVKDRRARLVTVMGVLGALVVVGLVLARFVVAPQGAVLHDYTSPLLIEFAAGIMLAAMFDQCARAPAALGVGLLGLGGLLLVVNYRLIVEDGMGRVLILGIPAMCIVAGALMMEANLARRVSKLVLLVGDASYSLYLTHPIAISAAAVIWERAHLPVDNSIATLGFVPCALAAALIFAVMVYRYVEKPLLGLLVSGGRDHPALPAALLEERT
ncbi:MAG: acyltransferase [Acidocella sp.]|nr:acyltransferase [Acidocella sp.]